MNFKDMLDKLSVLSEATKETEKGRVHKAEPGGYGRKYDTDEEGDEKDGDKDAKKPTEKRGRGRPAKTGAHVSSPAERKKQKEREQASKDLQSFIVGNVPKKSKELEKLPKKKHSLKEFFDQIDQERLIQEATPGQALQVKPMAGAAQLVDPASGKVVATGKADKINAMQRSMAQGEVQMPKMEEAEGKKWIQKAIDPSKKGALRRKLGAKEGEPIPAGKLEKATHSKDPTTARQARLAQTLRKINKESVNEGWSFDEAGQQGVAEGLASDYRKTNKPSAFAYQVYDKLGLGQKNPRAKGDIADPTNIHPADTPTAHAKRLNRAKVQGWGDKHTAASVKGAGPTIRGKEDPLDSLGRRTANQIKMSLGQHSNVGAKLPKGVAEGSGDDNAIWNRYGHYTKQDLMKEFPNITPKDAQSIVNFAEYGWSQHSEAQKFRNEVVKRVKLAMGQQGMAESKLNEVERPTADNMSAMGAGLGAGRSNAALEEAKKTVKKDNKAEKAGKRVAKDIEYDEKVKDKIHGKKRHSEDEKAERAGKKVARDIEYDEKKDKKKKMNESAHRHSSARLMGKAHALAKEGYNCKYEDMEEAKMYHEGYKEGLDECYGLMPIRGVVVGEEMPAATVPGMASQAMPTMEDDLDEMDKGEWMKHKAKTTPGPTFNAFGQTHNDSDVLGEFAFESLDKQLSDLLTEGEKVEEGMSVSISKGQQGAPDSVTVSAQDSEAEKLLGFIKQVGLGIFGDAGQSNYGSPMSAEPKHSHGEIEVVDDHDGMMSLMKKMSGMDQGGEDYRDEEHHDDEHGHDHEEEGSCNECGYMESQCKCDEEMVEDESYDQEEEEVAEQTEEMEEGGDIDELRRLAGTVKPAPSMDQKRGIEEANPPDSGAKDSEIGAQSEAEEDAALAAQSQQDKTYTVNEDGDEASEEPEEGMAESEEDKDKLDEWANEAGKRGTDAAFLTDDEFMIDTITSGLNKRKVTGQTTIPVIASQGARDGNEDINAWKKLAGLSK